ncbi:Signal peptidase I [termite gut metagenome]|uniref:Signal peptidase I n=1 Tax=termite gut metagenome TaxID=433724 RepID=A0A5J4RNH2_9ZZZZ
MKRGSKWLIAISGAAIIVLLLHLFAFTSYYIPSAGMENTLMQGECIIVNKWSYGLRLPFMSLFSYTRLKEKRVEKGDITVFNNPANTLQPVIDRREIFIGRCGGVPGDTLPVDSFFTTTLPAGKQVNSDEKALYSPARNSGITRTLTIPQKGQTVKIELWNAMLFRNTIVLHERKQAEVIDNTLYIDDAPVHEYTFSQNYYWMVSDNSVNLANSRLFGFVPQSHIIGKAFSIWFSKERDTSVFKGYRWNRFFKKIP